jgi:DMSO/TMAO reductase YedYZ molybdopterin-dependent catalytic subunit
MRELPPGQAETKRFPCVGERQPGPGLTVANGHLLVEGEVAAPLPLTYAEVLGLPQRDFTMDVHCVTGWTRFQTTFTGLPLADLLARAQPTAAARFVQFVAYSDRKHDTSLPLDVVLRDSWLVHAVEGEPLSSEHGGPLRVVTDGKYFYKSLKWVHRIILHHDDVPGYWERESAYHNHADPFREERYDDSRSATAEQTAQFRGLDSFAAYHRSVSRTILIRANLSNWTPRSRDLRGVQLKNCSFDGADLRAADFRGANLTLSKFFRADLTGADFTGADLEGVDFSGANLSGVRLVDVSLSAAKFFMRRRNGTLLGLKGFQGMVLQRARGLLEAQEEYLRQCGIVNLG